MQTRSEETKGFFYGLGAYAAWGFVPLYWPLLEPASSYEILAHRIIWSLVFMVGLNTVRRGWRPVLQAWRNRRTRNLLILAAALITINWGIYIWAIVHSRVVDASLGYFITPLLSVALGIVVFQERLRRAQWTAVAIGAGSLIILTVDAHAFPWIGVILAMSFGSYGLVKKLAQVDAVESLTIETAVALPAALAYLGWLEIQGRAAFPHISLAHSLIVVSAGVITAVPLLGFGAAAIRVPLSTLGLLQYCSPVLQFAVGVVAFHEAMTPMRWVGFVCLWIGLVVYSTDMWRHSPHQR